MQFFKTIFPRAKTAQFLANFIAPGPWSIVSLAPGDSSGQRVPNLDAS
jgi:hypothetical protein